jgi:hypothetical protein
MNLIIFFYFVIINNIISACIIFEESSDGACHQFYQNVLGNRTHLRCVIHNPLTKINSTACEDLKIYGIVIVMRNLDDMENFCLHNNETVMTFLHLFQTDRNQRWVNSLTIELDNLSSSNQRELMINRQWIKTFFGHHKGFYETLSLIMKATDWRNVKLTIHGGVNVTMEIAYIHLQVERNSVTCRVDITPPRFYQSSYMKEACRDFIAFTDRGM